jgi:serine/threonine-protein kinase
MPAIADLPRVDWHRLNRLLEAALALEGEARGEWLRQLPAAEADLVPLLERLLTAADATETADFAVRPPLPAAEQPGQRIGPFRLISPLGEGGMGAVWLAARADGAFERQVALKLPHAEWIDRGLAQRFARERAVLASLNHPNIAQLFDAGWSETGRPYLALEYVEGEPLLAWCDAHGLDTAARLRLYVDVVQAVAHAHAHLVVHRDLKPSNVLVTADGRVKLLDFGIAKLLAEDTASAAETELTRASGRALTPSYAAPEQVLGQPVTTATDIYALGVMLFELLTGERPYRLQRTEVASRAALEQAIVRVDAATPSAVVKDMALKRALRGDLDAIVLKALKKQPEQRYRTAAELADDLQRVLEHRPVQAQRDSRAYRLRRFVVRNRYAVGAVSAVMLALVMGLVATLWQARQTREEAEHATTIKQFVLSVIQEADPQASQRTREADMALLDATRDRVARELATRPDLQLEVRLAIATAYRNRGDWKRARETLRKAVDEARGKVDENNLDLLTARVQLLEWPIVDGAKAWDELIELIALAEALGKPAIPLLIEARLARWSLGLASGQFESLDDDASLIAEAHEVIALAERTYPPGHANVVRAKMALAQLFDGISLRKTEALSVLEAAWREVSGNPLMGPAHPVRLLLQSRYGVQLCKNGRAEEGLGLLRDGTELARNHHGPSSRTLAVMVFNRGAAALECGDLNEALRSYRESYAIAADAEPPGSLGRSGAATGLLIVLLRAFRPHDALPLIEEVSRSYTTLPGPVIEGRQWVNQFQLVRATTMLGETERASHLAEDLLLKAEGSMSNPWRAGLARWSLARALRLGGDPIAAESVADEGLANARAHPRLEFLTVFIAEVGAIKLELGKCDEALRLLDEALAPLLSKQNGPLRQPDDSQHFVWRGQILLQLQRTDEARYAFERAYEYWPSFDPDHPMAAEAAWWYGHSLIATGEVARGKAMVADARPRLAASFLPHLRPLATAPAPIPLPANRTPKAKAQVAAN